MLKIAICDDDKYICSNIESIIRKNKFEIEDELNTEVFFSGKELVNALDNECSYDLIFLDIQMDGMDGVETGKYLRKTKKDNYSQIVYISSYEDQLKELFQNRPFGFISKPFKSVDIVNIINQYVEISKKDHKFLEFNFNNVNYRVRYEDIMFIESNARNIIINTTDKKYQFYGKIRDIRKTINNNKFLCIHNSYIVNYDYVKIFYYDSIILANDLELPISQANRKIIRNILQTLQRGEYV